MALHVQVRRKGDLLLVFGQWEAGLPLFQNYTLRVEEGYTAAETVEIDMLEMNLVASWTWTKASRFGQPELWGQFTRAGGHKEIRDSKAHKFDLEKEN